MKKISLVVLSFALILISALFVGAEELHTAPYVSLWSDYRTVAPVGWTGSQHDDSEKSGAYTETYFKPYDSGYALIIRWYEDYATHRALQGHLIMYGNANAFIQGQSAKYSQEWVIGPACSLVEPPHEVNVGGKKAQRFVGRFGKLPLDSDEYYIKGRISNRNGFLELEDDVISKNAGKQAWVAVPAPSGFYVLGYFAPEEGFAKYEKFFNQMAASFEILKDGPKGNPLPGSSLQIESPGKLQSASPQEILNQYVADLRGLQGNSGGIDVAGRWEFPGEKDFHYIFEVRGNQLIATFVYDNEELARDYGKKKPFFSATMDGRKFTGTMSYYKFEGSSVSGIIDENNQKIEWIIPERGVSDRVTRQGQSPSEESAMALRKKIIQHVSTMQPPPAIPDKARSAFVQGNTIMKVAKNTGDYKLAISKYNEALIEAPWWGDSYNNLAIALNSAGQADLAKQAMALYISTNPKDAGQAQNKIYEIEAQQALQKQRDVAMKAKYGGDQGGSFGWESLFRYGAIVKNMSFDASGNERTISLKVATRKENGLLLNYLTIFDMTSRNDTFGQKFSMDWRGTQSFFLDDRTYPNKYYMTLTVTSYGDGDANITIRPTNNASASIQTSLTALLRERASQAVYAGDTLNIGGRELYVLGQGGAKGALLFFPVEIKDQLEHGNARDLMPAFVANVNYRGSDGSNKSYTNTDLGTVNGTHYHLEFIDRYWQPKVGSGEDH